ncbi:MAG: hypothetical protein RIQ81_2493 [Pseudomonadota bacterium]|jgi:chromosome segregation ATPase
MNTILMAVLLIVDVGLIYAVWQFSRRRTIEADIVAELAEERRLIEEIRHSIREELSSGQSRIREATDRVSRLAMEAEQEVASSGNVIRSEVEKALAGLGGSLNLPMAELAQRQEQLAGLLRKVENEKNLLRKALSRAEMMIKALDEKAPFEEVMGELVEKKYTDARSMLAQGMSVPKVAIEVNLSEPEVRLLAGLASHQTR